MTDIQVFDGKFREGGVSVVGQSMALDASQQASVLNVSVTLQLSRSRVVVVAGSSEEILVLLSYLGDSAGLQIIWTDPKNPSKSLSSLPILGGSAVNNGWFFIGLPEINSTKLQPADRGNLNSTSFVQAYNALAIWMAAARSVSLSSEAELEIARRMRNASLTTALSTPLEAALEFDASSGERTGSALVANLQLGYAASGTPSWRALYLWGEQGGIPATSEAPASPQFRPSVGLQTNPGAVKLQTVPVGFLLTSKVTDGWAELIGGFLAAADAAVSVANSNSSILSGRAELKLLIEKIPESNSENIDAAIRLKERGCVGYLGAVRSSHSAALQNYAGGKQYAQVAFSATADNLSVKNDFPVRVV